MASSKSLREDFSVGCQHQISQLATLTEQKGFTLGYIPITPHLPLPGLKS